MTTYVIRQTEQGPCIRCLMCEAESYHTADIEKLYCARCHLFHEIVRRCRTDVAKYGHTHDCGEWRTALGRCALCNRQLEIAIDGRTLYDVSRDICHEFGFDWRDPRTGVNYPPPKK